MSHTVSGTISPTTRPALTEALECAALRALERELQRHAELLIARDDRAAEYVRLISVGTWLTSHAAQDIAFEVVALERTLRALEASLVGGPDDDRY